MNLRTAGIFLLMLQLDRGQQAFRMKDWPVAERYFAEAIRKDPANAAAHKWLGMTYAAQEKFLLAETPFRQACEIQPSEPDACYYLGRTLFTLSRFERALEAYARSTPKSARVILGQALAHEALNHTGDADRLYREAIAAGDRQAGIDYERFKKKQAVVGDTVTPVQFVPKALPFTVRNGAAGKKRLIETMLAGAAILDFDGDGKADIFLANGEGGNGLLRNNGDGTFTDRASHAGVTGPAWAMGVAAADFDNDGDTDLFVTGVREHRLYVNRGNGTFEPAPFPKGEGWSVAAVWFDYDNDGLLDLFEARYVDWSEEKETYCGTAEFRQYCHPKYYAGLANALYRNAGGGRFEDVSVRSGIARHKGKGMGAAAGDFDGDGRLDIFVANDTVPNFLFRNRGDGTFEEVAAANGVALNEDGVALSSMGVEFSDLDNDGREDLFLTALSNETFPLFRNTGKGFVDGTKQSGIAKASLAWTGWSIAAADFNNDGWKDLLTANGHVMDNAELTSGRQSRQPKQIYLNRRRSFEGVTIPGAAFHRGAAHADFDGDGRVDAVVTRLNEPAQILWNRTEGAGRWIAFTLEGRQSNRDGVGALVEIETASGKQWRRIAAGNGYGASSSKEVHFGLGSAERVDRVVVHWPSGIRQDAGPLPAGQRVRLTEK